jgi:hypothetical protein
MKKAALVLLITFFYSCSKKSSGPTMTDVTAKAAMSYDLTHGVWLITLSFNPTISNATGEAAVGYSGYKSGQYIGRGSVHFNYTTGNTVTNSYIFNTGLTHASFDQVDSVAVGLITCPNCTYTWHY